ncbi:MAG: Trm112 family protein [Sphingomonadaceae bacterium]
MTDPQNPDRRELDQRLLDILVCPLTRGPLRYDRTRQVLISETAGLAYPVRDGVPVMLIEEATPWPPETVPTHLATGD